MKTIYFLAFSLLYAIPTIAQSTGSVEGTVKTSDGSPAEFVNVTIEGTSRGAVADRNGYFEIKSLKPGSYQVVATYVGLETQRRAVSIAGGQIAKVDFVLAETSRQLAETVVSSGRNSIESPFGSKMPLKNMENAQGDS